MSEIEKTGVARSDFKLSGPTAFVFASHSSVLLTLKVDGSYELGGTFEELLDHDQPICRAFGAALRDQYEAGRRGVPAPKAGSAIKSDHRAVLAAPAPEPRWKAMHGSDHQCCMDAQVVDTTKETIKGYPDAICETHDMADAEKIADALNAAEPI